MSAAARGGAVVALLALLHLPLVLRAQAPDPPTGRIDVTITGIRAAQGGTLVIALYDREPGWLDLDSARTVIHLPVDADSAVTSFDAVPFDSGYAIAVIHDKNGNDKMDMRWFPFPKPKEGAGVSGNHTRMGKPRYREARFGVTGPESHQRITLRY